MAETPTRSGPTALGTSTATIKTAGGAATWVLVRSIVVTNVHSAALTVTVGVGTSNTDTAAKRIASALPLAVGETVELLAPGFLPLLGHATTPDLLYALCSVANGVTLTLGHVEGP